MDDPEADGAGSPGPTVLVVEEELNLRVLLREMLGKAGYRVAEAGDSSEAMRILRGPAGRIDLMITELVMPQMTGPELEAWGRSFQPGLKTLYLTGHSQDTVLSQGIPLADLEYLTKPVSLKALVSKVGETLGQPG